MQCTRFWIQLFVRDGPVQSQFCIREGIDKQDTLYNVVTSDTQLMHESVPWRGPREKNPEFVRSFIEAASQVGDIILDWNASTGKSKFALQFFTPCMFLHSFLN